MSEQVEHVGKDAARCNDWSRSGRCESAFAEAWRETNNPPHFLNRGIGTLAWLLKTDYVTPIHELDDRLRFTGEVTQEEATAAASAIQWLGTNCGTCWLEETLKKCGGRIVWDR